MIIAKFIIGLVSHFLVNILFLKNKFLLDDPDYSVHKKFINSNNKVVLSGGLVFLILFLFYTTVSSNLKLFIFLIFLIGIISDLKILNVPSFRFFLQFLVVLSFVYLLDVGIYFTDLKYLDLILEYKFSGIIFSVFCILVLINGSNFFDGLNTLVIGYYILVLFSLLSLIKIFNINYDLELIINFILILFVILILNCLNKSFIGDSGAYSISCLTGYICIDFFKNIQDFSVLFIVVILWYPAFETLFSIIRKILFKFNPTFPDNNHLHHYLFNFMCSKVKKNFLSNILAANLINIYNLAVFAVAIFNYKNSLFLSFILAINIFLYIYLYNVLKNER